MYDASSSAMLNTPIQKSVNILQVIFSFSWENEVNLLCNVSLYQGTNLGLVSVLPSFSKILERLIVVGWSILKLA